MEEDEDEQGGGEVGGHWELWFGTADWELWERREEERNFLGPQIRELLTSFTTRPAIKRKDSPMSGDGPRVGGHLIPLFLSHFI